MGVFEIVELLFAGVLGCLWLAMLWLGQLHRPKRTPPGSFGWPLVGETLDFFRDAKSKYPHIYADRRKARYGPVFSTHQIGYPCVMSVSPEMNRFILQNEGKYFVSHYPRTLRNLFGKGALVRVHGDMQKRLHNVVLTFITSPKLKDNFMADDEYLIKSAMSNWEGRTVYLEHEAKTIGFNIIAKYLLGLLPGEESAYLMQEYRNCIEGVMSVPLRIPFTQYSKSMKGRENCVNIIKRIIEERRQRPQSELFDILQALMTETDEHGEKISDTIICNNIINLFAGGETSPMALMCAVKFISECPKALEQLREEHLTIRRRKGPGEPLTRNDYTNSMTFTHHVINETLRLANPAIGVLLRKAIKGVEVNGYLIPKDWLVVPYIGIMHIDENVYPDPLTFNPWRWEKKIPSVYFTPFGGGPRICPGQELAKREICVFLHYLVTQFTWVLHGDEQINFPVVSFKSMLPITVKALQHEILP